jgi:hypothetical protein
MAAQESWEEREARQRKESEARFHTACEVLQRLDIHIVEVAYDGSGDEGFIQKVHYQPEPSAGIPEGLQNQIEDYAYHQLPGGWEINEGSYGTMRINVRTRKAHCDHHWRELDPADWLDDEDEEIDA